MPRRHPKVDPYSEADIMRLAMATVVLKDAAEHLSREYGKGFPPGRCYELLLTSAALVLEQRRTPAL